MEKLLCQATGKNWETEKRLCAKPATWFYQYSSTTKIICVCEEHKLRQPGFGWDEITYEDAVVIWVHKS
jgi:hypothetical protein